MTKPIPNVTGTPHRVHGNTIEDYRLCGCKPVLQLEGERMTPRTPETEPRTLDGPNDECHHPQEQRRTQVIEEPTIYEVCSGCEHVMAIRSEARSAGAAPLGITDREIIAAWMIDHGFTTGHGNTTTDLLAELDWQLRLRHGHDSAPSVVDLNAEMLRVLQFANYAWGMTLPTDPATVNTLRAALHSGDYKLVRS